MYKHWHYYTDKDTSVWPVVCNKIQFQRQKMSVAQKPETVPCFIGSWYFVFSYRPWTGHASMYIWSFPLLHFLISGCSQPINIHNRVMIMTAWNTATYYSSIANIVSLVCFQLPVFDWNNRHCQLMILNESSVLASKVLFPIESFHLLIECWWK